MPESTNEQSITPPIDESYIPTEEEWDRDNFFANLPGGRRRLNDPEYLKKIKQGTEKTRGKFFGDIDRVLKECDLDVNYILGLQTYIDQKYSEERRRPIEARLKTFVYPAYVALRKMGYTDNNLTG